MPRGVPKPLQDARALVSVLATKTEEGQAQTVQQAMDTVSEFQVALEQALPKTFELLQELRDAHLEKDEAPGAKVNLEAARLMMEHTHRLHPERQGHSGEPVNVNILIQMLTQPKPKAVKAE